jgi:hypothetical protein
MRVAVTGFRSSVVRKLIARSGTARQQIAAQFVKGVVRPPEDPKLYAWGQYLEVRGQTAQRSLGNHYGIYGTSAGVQVLTMQSFGQYREVVTSGARVLPLVLRDVERNESVHRRFVEKGDLNLVYKLSALLDAARVLHTGRNVQGLEPDIEGILQRLLEIRHPDAGWPDYKSSEDYQGPNTHATAVALLAISRIPPRGEALTACHEALRWFATQNLESQSIATLSMVVIAISNLVRNPSDGTSLVPEEQDLQQRCEDAIAEWLASNAPSEVRRSLEGIEYWLPEHTIAAPAPLAASGPRFTFLLYLPHCLAALAVLESARLRGTYLGRQFVVEVVSLIVDELIAKQGCFVAAGRNMVSTVEHLWLYRLLHEFRSNNLYQSWWIALVDRVREESRRHSLRVVSVGVLVAAIVTGAVVTQGKVSVALTALSGVVVTVLATIVVDFIRHRT